ncbi:hypothetical protein EII10_01235 [Actinomyces bowdenii]|uniref:histidine kinase n=1 Tax=Actinomyces bowdenii TaxID=131109 RepID=A0A3P1VAI9_9ACTO|nr:hypothetical protein EII10_01235 [Actinomyces bowdenii]
MNIEDAPLATQVLAGTIRSTVSFLACARMGILTAIGVVAAVAWPGTGAAVLPLLALPMSALLLWGWSWTSHAVLNGWLFPVGDAVIAGILCVVVVTRLDAPVLGGAYLLLSIVLMGITRSAPWVAGWLVITGAIVLVGHGPASPYGGGMGLALILVSFVLTAMLALRMGNQFRQTGHLTDELAEARIQRAASDERLLIARDLHDSVAKSVHGIRMLSEALRDDLEGADPGTRRLAEVLFESADEASREARAVLDGLNSSAQVQDLSAHLSQQVETWGRRTGHRTVLDLSEDLRGQQAQGEWAWNVERVLGELLANVEKHAQAETAHVTMRRQEETLVVVVEDDGRGTPEALHRLDDLASEGHYGLAGVRERLRRFEGALHIGQRADGPGTAVTMTVPLPRQEHGIA